MFLPLAEKIKINKKMQIVCIEFTLKLERGFIKILRDTVVGISSLVL